MNPLQPRQQINRRDYNAAMEQARRVKNMRGGPGSLFRNTPSGIGTFSPTKYRWGILTAAPAGSGQGYAWSEISDDGTGGAVVLAGGMTGTTTKLQAFPWNGVDVPLTGPDGQPTVVLLWAAQSSATMVFMAGGGGSGFAMLRITAYSTPNPVNGRGMFPALLQNFDPTALFDYTDSSSTDTVTYTGATAAPLNAWVICPNEYFNGGGLNITIAGDGTAYRLARDTGWKIDPITSGHLADGPHAWTVYDTAQYAALVGVDCDVSDGTVAGEMGV